MIEPIVARDSFVIPALIRIGLHTQAAERLLMGTAAIESNFKNFIQFGGGPARGMFQMEAVTYHDLFDRFLGTKAHLKIKNAVVGIAIRPQPTFTDLSTDHLFAAAMARIKYFSIRAPIPTTLADQAEYWWTHYNCRSPHGLKPKDYIKSWNTYCEPIYGNRLRAFNLPRSYNDFSNGSTEFA